jgi:phospholipase/carboxylesterase
MIWLHGLGAGYDDMVALQQELKIDNLPIRHVFLQAPMRSVTLNQGYQMPAWYDLYGMSLLDREDEQGILSSEMILEEAIQKECDKGIEPSRIFLSGFSQGGSMALFTGLRHEQPLGGVVALSSYLLLSSSFKAPLTETKSKLPIFLAYGEDDPLVLPKWTKLSIERIKEMGALNIEVNAFPMAHSVCVQEIEMLKRWINKVVIT